MARTVLVAALIAMLGTKALGAEPRIYFDDSRWESAIARQCFEKSQGPSDEWKCAQAEFQLQDARLNKAYDALRAARSESQVRDLLFEERAWINFKKSFCELWSEQDRDANPGLDWDYYVLLCTTQVTSIRASELEYALSQVRAAK